MKPQRVLLFLAAVVAALASMALVAPDEGVSLAGVHLRYPTMSSVLATASKEEPAPMDTASVLELSESAHLRDSVNYYNRLTNNGPLRFWFPSASYLDRFWHTVEQARRSGRTVRILHYGDSQIEMDHITSRLRSYMQNTFGGGGPGMVPASTLVPSPTYTISSSGSLTHLASFGDSTTVRSRNNYGPMMQSFRMNGNATINVRTSHRTNVDDRTKRFTSVKLIYNNLGGSVRATLDSTFTTHQAGISSFSWKTDSLDRFRMRVNGHADLYCMLVDAGPGVAVDNIPMRGCSGHQFTLVNAERLTAAYSQMDVGMIILQFGGNSVPYIRTTQAVSKYSKAIGEQIDHLHRSCPGVPIIFVGPSDMSKSINGRMQTYPILPELVDSLIATALDHNAAYWSIYHAMGGQNSMPEWKRQGLAGSDYIHFSQRGADLMGDRLAEAFDNSYTLYKLRRRLMKTKR